MCRETSVARTNLSGASGRPAFQGSYFAAEKTPIPFATARSGGSLGWLRTDTDGAPGARATRVDEPPPSRLNASAEPNERIVAATSVIDMPVR